MDVASRASWRLNVWSNNVHGAATVYNLVAPEASTGLEYASAAPLRGFGCSRNDLLIGREEALQVLGTSLVGHAGGAFNSQKLLIQLWALQNPHTQLPYSCNNSPASTSCTSSWRHVHAASSISIYICLEGVKFKGAVFGASGKRLGICAKGYARYGVGVAVVER